MTCCELGQARCSRCHFESALCREPQLRTVGCRPVSRSQRRIASRISGADHRGAARTVPRTIGSGWPAVRPVELRTGRSRWPAGSCARSAGRRRDARRSGCGTSLRRPAAGRRPRRPPGAGRTHARWPACRRPPGRRSTSPSGQRPCGRAASADARRPSAASAPTRAPAHAPAADSSHTNADADRLLPAAQRGDDPLAIPRAGWRVPPPPRPRRRRTAPTIGQPTGTAGRGCRRVHLRHPDPVIGITDHSLRRHGRPVVRHLPGATPFGHAGHTRGNE